MKIAEIFKSRQGEGANCGREAVFVRFSGCNLSCPWCDTDWRTGEDISATEIIQRVETMACGKKFLVVTGGEPLLQENLSLLLATLKRLGWEIAIETNGLIRPTSDLRASIDYLAVSPKAEFFAQYNPEKMVREADEVRIVASSAAKVEFCKKINVLIRASNYFISPCEKNGVADFLAAAELLGELGRPWLLSVQLHKLAGFK